MLVLSRQNMPILPGSSELATEGISKGAYVLIESDGKQADIILIGTGSEVSLLVEARKALAEQGYDESVVSMPSWELFEKQPLEYQKGAVQKVTL